MFAFDVVTWPQWDRVCQEAPYREGTMINAVMEEEIASPKVFTHKAGERVVVNDVNQACQNYQQYRQWLAVGE